MGLVLRTAFSLKALHHAAGSARGPAAACEAQPWSYPAATSPMCKPQPRSDPGVPKLSPALLPAVASAGRAGRPDRRPRCHPRQAAPGTAQPEMWQAAATRSRQMQPSHKCVAGSVRAVRAAGRRRAVPEPSSGTHLRASARICGSAAISAANISCAPLSTVSAVVKPLPGAMNCSAYWSGVICRAGESGAAAGRDAGQDSRSCLGAHNSGCHELPPSRWDGFSSQWVW